MPKTEAPVAKEVEPEKGEIVRSKHPVSLRDWCEGIDSPE
jgi:hypothetical protein